MAASAYMRFGDADQYAGAVRAANARVMAASHGDTRAALMRADLRSVWLQSGEEAFARTAHIANAPDRAIMTFAQADNTRMHWRGQAMPPGTLMAMGLGHEGYQRTEGPTHWASLSLPPEGLAELGVGAELGALTSNRLWRPAPGAMRRLQALHRQVETLARETPWVLEAAEPVQALEQALLVALADCLATGAAQEETAPQRLGGAIIARLDALLEAAPGRPLYLPQVCAAVGVSRRTLHNYCREHLGTSPERYLRQRRLYMARRRLLDAAPAVGAVTRIATAVGFFELGRFAVVYRDVFGESPSATLRREADDRLAPAGRRIGAGVAALV